MVRATKAVGEAGEAGEQPLRPPTQARPAAGAALRRAGGTRDRLGAADERGWRHWVRRCVCRSVWNTCGSTAAGKRRASGGQAAGVQGVSTAASASAPEHATPRAQSSCVAVCSTHLGTQCDAQQEESWLWAEAAARWPQRTPLRGASCSQACVPACHAPAHKDQAQQQRGSAHPPGKMGRVQALILSRSPGLVMPSMTLL
mgnify:CR=1 FL=1